MSNLTVCFNAIAPIMLIMALGYLAKSMHAITRTDVQRMNSAAFKYLMPLMLYYNIYSSDLSSAVNPRLIIFGVCGILAVFSVSLLHVRAAKPGQGRCGVMVQGLFRSNFVIIGIPLARNLLPEGTDLGMVVVLVAVIVPMINILSVVVLEKYSGKQVNGLLLVRDIAANPLVLGTAAGILTSVLGIRLPVFVVSALEQIAGATSPLLLFLLGAFFSFDGFKDCIKPVLFVAAGRLVIIPAVVLGTAALLGFRGVEIAGLLGAFGSATAIASFAMTQEIGGDAELAGNIVVFTSAACMLTLFLWSLLLKNSGLL